MDKTGAERLIEDLTRERTDAKDILMLVVRLMDENRALRKKVKNLEAGMSKMTCHESPTNLIEGDKVCVIHTTSLMRRVGEVLEVGRKGVTYDNGVYTVSCKKFREDGEVVCSGGNNTLHSNSAQWILVDKNTPVSYKIREGKEYRFHRLLGIEELKELL